MENYSTAANTIVNRSVIKMHVSHAMNLLNYHAIVERRAEKEFVESSHTLAIRFVVKR